VGGRANAGALLYFYEEYKPMRKDMDKLLVTRPRIGHKYKNLETKAARSEKDFDKLPKKTSMKPKYRKGERKSFNEYLNPLKRFLYSKCNKHWDKVYSEICENMKKDSAVKAHIFVHLEDYVELKPQFIDGHPHFMSYDGLKPMYKEYWGPLFYVDSKGFLRSPPEKQKEKPKVNPNLFEKDERTYIKRQDSTWFELKLEDIEIGSIDCFVYSPPDWIIDVIGSSRLRRKKAILRTIKKKEKKDLGLS
tara:strand:+ start:1155 stop:1898 length:744 start_codon:yes stop_codon:yes gene_type:complete